MRIAVADGTGTPRSFPELTRLAAHHGDLHLVLGWMPYAEPDLDPRPFADLRGLDRGERAAAVAQLWNTQNRNTT